MERRINRRRSVVTSLLTRDRCLLVLLVGFLFLVFTGYRTLSQHATANDSKSILASVFGQWNGAGKHGRRLTTAVSTTDASAGISVSRSTNETRFVSLCPERMYGNHRIGNHLFMLAAMLHLALRTGRDIIMPAGDWVLDEVFQLENDTLIHHFRKYTEAEQPCPCAVLTPANLYNGDERLDGDEGLRRLGRLPHRTLALCGLYQTYRYADAASTRLRGLLSFRSHVTTEAETFAATSGPADWLPGSFFRVGMHVRRGDYATMEAAGLTVVDEVYLRHAIEFFGATHSRVHFVVASDDPVWTTEKLSPWIRKSDDGRAVAVDTQGGNNRSSVAMTISVGHTAAMDLALLASCDAVVVSTGSFGWWAAWLANKTTVYYRRWPREGTTLEMQLNRYTYFPDSWIPMV